MHGEGRASAALPWSLPRWEGAGPCRKVLQGQAAWPQNSREAYGDCLPRESSALHKVWCLMHATPAPERTERAALPESASHRGSRSNNLKY